MKARPHVVSRTVAHTRAGARLTIIAVLALATIAGLAAASVRPAAAFATQVESTFRVTDDGVNQQHPDLSDAAFVYQQHSATAGWNIFAGVLPGAGTAVCTAPGDQILPRVSGRFVVWEDRRAGNADIYGYDTETQKEFVICDERYDQTAPAISGTWVVWQDDRGHDWDVYGATIDPATDTVAPANGADLSPAVGVQGNGDQTEPAVAGDTVVWVDTRWGDPDIAGYNRAADYFFPVCTASSVQDEPAISGDTVVWSDARHAVATDTTPARGTDIYGADLLTGRAFPICTASGDQVDPRIDQDLVVWTDLRSTATGPDVRGYDLTTAAPFRVTTGQWTQQSPVVSNSRVLWAGTTSKTGKGDLYGAILSPWTATIAIQPEKGSSGWTRSGAVDLRLKGQGKSGLVTQMLLANKGGVEPVWQPYWSSKDKWQLTGGDGLKTVFATYKDISGAVSPQVSSSITLDTHGPDAHVPHPVSVDRGSVGTIDYRVNDNLSPTASTTIKLINRRGAIVKVWVIAKAKTGTALHRHFVCRLARGVYKIRVWALDLAGNDQQQVGANKLTVK